MNNEKKLTLIGHIMEIRGRLVKCSIAMVITTAISFIFADRIFQFMLEPLGGVKLNYIDITEMIGVYMKVCLVAGLVLAMPYLIFHLVMFVAPALNPKEKKYVYIILPWVGMMFIVGVGFGYLVMLPRALDWLLNFGSDIATPMLRIENYIGVVTRVLLSIGLVFELPVLTTFLAKIGVVNYKWLASKRKFAIIIAFILAALITPTVDPVNEIIVAVPLIILYEMGIWLAKLVQKRPQPVPVDVPE